METKDIVIIFGIIAGIVGVGSVLAFVIYPLYYDGGDKNDQPTPTPTLTQTPSVIPSPLHSPTPTITEAPEPTPSPIPTETPIPIPTPTPTVTITDPKAGDYVPWRYTVKGTSNIEPNSDLNIYVFIYAWDWYAQPKAIISSNGNWETRDRCRFGNPEHGGLDYTYDICAIVITKDFEVDEQFANLPDYKAKSEIIRVIRE